MKIIKSTNESIIKQLGDVNKLLKITDCTVNTKQSLKILKEIFILNNKGLIDSINFILNNFFNTNLFYENLNNLKNLLNYQNYVR